MNRGEDAIQPLTVYVCKNSSSYNLYMHFIVSILYFNKNILKIDSSGTSLVKESSG